MQGCYQRLQPGADGSLLSESTGVLFRPDGRRLRLEDERTGAPLLRREELEAKAAAAEERARALEEELARLRAERG